MKPIIKWPGGKTREIAKIEQLIPEYRRYIEPFFGGGALYFHLAPKIAAINDISTSLMQYYTLIKNQDQELYNLLMCYNNSFKHLISVCRNETNHLLQLFYKLQDGLFEHGELKLVLNELVLGISDNIISGFKGQLLLDQNVLIAYLSKMLENKYIRTVVNYNKKPFSTADLCENLITGFASGYYMYFRKIYNDINLGRLPHLSEQYQAANFYFIREYCYGSMFRYNGKDEFNIPYGGMSYNKKDIQLKIDCMFNKEVEQLFSNTDIHCCDFEEFFERIRPTADDFIFLDPPYDSDFSNYEGKDFTKQDQERLANVLKKTPAKFIMVIKKTEFITSLYETEFNIISFNKQYAYNMRSRNDRDTEHLIITNLPV